MLKILEIFSKIIVKRIPNWKLIFNFLNNYNNELTFLLKMIFDNEMLSFNFAFV